MRREIEGNRFPIITATYNVLRYKLTTKSNNRQKNGRTIRPRWVPPCPAATTESVDTNARGEDADLRRRPRRSATHRPTAGAGVLSNTPARGVDGDVRGDALRQHAQHSYSRWCHESTRSRPGRRPSTSIRSGGRQLLLHISPAGRNHPPILTSWVRRTQSWVCRSTHVGRPPAPHQRMDRFSNIHLGPTCRWDGFQCFRPELEEKTKLQFILTHCSRSMTYRYEILDDLKN